MIRKVILALYIPLLFGIFQTGETKALFSDTGTTTESFSASTWVNTGSVVINEVMWMGSTASPNDEWIELKNTTVNPINLTGWQIQGAGAGGAAITLSGIIPANGFFLIMKNAVTSSAIADSITPDQIDSTIDLDNNGEQLSLTDDSSRTIDQTTTGTWPAGSDGANKQSMERNDTPSDGTQGSSWHTCVDSGCNNTTFWDSSGTDYGTPKASNLSSNDPSSHDYVTTLQSPLSQIASQPEACSVPLSPSTPAVSQQTPLPSPTPTPAPTSTPDPSPQPTTSPEPTPTPTQTPTPSPDISPSPSPDTATASPEPPQQPSTPPEPDPGQTLTPSPESASSPTP